MQELVDGIESEQAEGDFTDALLVSSYNYYYYYYYSSYII
jgi:hypothetical protein